MEGRQKGLSSRLVHVGEAPDPATGAAVAPIYQTTTFAFPSNQSMLDLMEGRGEGFIYTRYGNPNFVMAEAKLADLEGSEAALVLASGMAATTTALLALLKSGERVLTHADIYGGSFGLLHDLLPRFGIEADFVDLTDLEQVEAALGPQTRAVFLETPSNPTLRVFDIGAISARAHRRGVRVVVDNTFATPVNQRPLQLGADAVVHSATKYLNGHSDVMAGAVCGDRDFIAACVDVFRKFGPNLNGFDAWLLIRGLKTLALRVARQNETALRLAAHLEGHAKVERVHYPGLPSHPQHALAARQMQGFGGVLAVELRGGQADVDRLLDSVQIFSRAVSLGSVESLITQPVAAVHHAVPAEFRALGGITPNLVRIAVGIEDAEDLVADMEQALS